MHILKMILALIFFVFSSAYSYDVDTHFYATAAILIKRGIKKEVSFKIAAYAQWIDESGITTPMTTERKRRLFHFPMPLMLREVSKPNAADVNDFLMAMENQTHDLLLKKGNFKDRVHGKDLGFLAEVIENNPMAYDILKKGLAKGDYVLVGAGLHILMDSYGHSGFSSIEGHAHAGHDPDAPYKHIEKYYRMIATAVKTTSLLLKAMPIEAIDQNVTIMNKHGEIISAFRASDDEIYDSFINDPKVKHAIEDNIQRSPGYTRIAVGTILASMYKGGVIRDPSFLHAILNDDNTFFREKTTEEIMTEIVRELLLKGQSEAERFLNLTELKDHYLKNLSMQLTIPEYIENEGSVYSGAKKISWILTRRFVAHNMDAEHQFLVDPEGPPREKEMSMRISAWQEVIQNLTGDKILFDAGLSLSEYIKKTVIERFKSKAQSNKNEPDFKPLSITELAELEQGLDSIKIGVNFKEQAFWNWKMFNIVYIDFLRYIEIKWHFKIADYRQAVSIKDKLHYLQSIIGWNALDSLPGSHNVIDPEVYYIQNEQKFKEALNDKTFKKIISPRQIQVLKEQFDRRRSETQSPKILLCKNIMDFS